MVGERSGIHRGLVVAAHLIRVLKPGGGALFFKPLGYNPLVNLYLRLAPDVRRPIETLIELDDLDPLREAFRVELEFHHLLAMVPQGLGKLANLLRLPGGKALYGGLRPMEGAIDRVDQVALRVVPPCRNRRRSSW